MNNSLKHFAFSFRKKNVRVLELKSMQGENINNISVILKKKGKKKNLFRKLKDSWVKEINKMKIDFNKLLDKLKHKNKNVKKLLKLLIKKLDNCKISMLNLPDRYKQDKVKDSKELIN